jgi:nucleoid-associated protein YgaU
MSTDDTWLLRVPFGVVELELAANAQDVRLEQALREESLREVRLLVRAFEGRDRAASRVVAAIVERTRGVAWLPGARELDPGSALGRFAVEELLDAARAGFLVARRRDLRAVAVPDDDAAPAQELGPTSEQPPTSKSWIGIVLLDQDGTPVPNRPYRVIQPDGTTVDGTLDSNGTAFVRSIDPGSCKIWCPYVEPHAEATYTAQAGDHLSGIAESFGFDDYTTVWNDPGNADLQQQRTDPHVLQPGDQVTIPELKAQPGTSKPTGAKHPFQLQRSPLKLRLTLLDLTLKAMASVPVTVAGTSLTTDGSGLVPPGGGSARG